MSNLTSGHPPGPSLEEVHRSVPVPRGRRFRRLIAFAGPAYLVAIGYMDPGNWATDIEGGSRFGYALLWVLLMSNAAALLLQTLSARLGLVTGRDLAQACRDAYGPAVRYVLFALCEVAIVATDLAELLGTAIGLNLLLNIPLLPAVLITGGDVLLLLAMQKAGIRKMEAFIVSLVAIIGVCFVVEISLCSPNWSGIGAGFRPQLPSAGALYVAIGILGATVMPHNLYLHSALVQSRNVARSREGVAQACRYNLADSFIALNGAFLVNAAILIVAAATFWTHGHEVTQLQEAHELLDRLLGTSVAPVAFAVALICAGQSSTLTGTLAAQITMEGFLGFRMRPWLRRVLTRLAAIVPAVAVIALMPAGRQGEGTFRLLIFSQVVLSLQLSFAVVPLVKFTSSRQKMGPFASPWPVRVLAWLTALVVIALNTALVVQQVGEWMAAAGTFAWIVGDCAILVGAALAGLLGYMIFQPQRQRAAPTTSPEEVAIAAAGRQRHFARIGVALEVDPTDSTTLAEAVALARAHRAELVLLHVVEGVGGQWYGPQTGDSESRQDETYLLALADRLRQDLAPQGVSEVRAVLGYGNAAEQLIHACRRERIELLVLRGHGHRGLSDIIHGTTITRVRHGLDIPILIVGQ